MLLGTPVSEQVKLNTKILKVDDTLGLVLGWAIICKQQQVEYFDLQDDSITEEAVLKGSADFIQHSRVAKEMHTGQPIGEIVGSFPLIEDVAKAFGIQCDTYGWMVAMKPSDDVLEKFKSGELTGFSIGGIVEEFEELEDAA